MGGLHKFMNWDGPILTDSGGFQVFSLAELCGTSRRKGVTFALVMWTGVRSSWGRRSPCSIQSNLGI